MALIDSASKNLLLRGMLLFVFLTAAVASHATSPPLVLARAPQSSASVTSEQWSPLVKALSGAIGREVDLKVYEERSEFEADLREGKVDLYFGNPGYGVVGHLRHGYLPLVRSDRKLLEGILVVRKDSDITVAEDLRGKVIAFPDQTAFAASLYIRSRLEEDFDLDYQPVFVGSHQNSYRAVLIGRAAAGAGVLRTLESEDPRLQANLRLIYTTPGIKSHPLMAHPRVSPALRKAIQKAILALNDTAEGKALLKDTNLQRPVVASYQADYLPIEAMVKKMYGYLLGTNEEN